MELSKEGSISFLYGGRPSQRNPDSAWQVRRVIRVVQGGALLWYRSMMSWAIHVSSEVGFRGKEKVFRRGE